MKKKIVIIILFSISFSSFYVLAETKPSYENIKYGQYERNVLDIWLAESTEPTPLVVFIHGGGFRGGDKSQARSGETLKYLEKCLDNKVSFAAINYRFRQTTRLDTIMLDAARAIQFLRSKSSEWNINKSKFGAFGGSAGGGASIWLAFNDDLADKSNSDLVLRESTRLTVAGHLTSQATYDFLKWPEILQVSKSWMEEMNNKEDLELYHIPDRTWYDSTEIIELRKRLDMPSELDKTDPPLFLQNYAPNIDPQNSNDVIHHPRHPIYLKKLYDSLGLDNAIVLSTTPVKERVEMLDFFFKYLLPITGIEEDTEFTKLIVSPNPASEYIEIRQPSEGFKPSEGSELIIYNNFGKCVMTVETKNFSSLQHINISHLPIGLYFIQIGNYSQKFMVVR
jgi:acetyl esterase/lipase